MNRCSGCGYLVPGAWLECRRCGASLAADRVPTASVSIAAAAPGSLDLLTLSPPPPSASAPDDALLPGTRRERVGPDTMLPREEFVLIRTPPPKRSRINAPIVVAAIVALCVIGGVYSLVSGRGPAKRELPTVLAARSPFAGIPTSLSEMVRIAAESSRHTALAAVIATAGPTGAPLTVTQLAGVLPNFQWVLGSQPSTTNTMISITSGQGIDVIAVSGTDRDICAFGRWSANVGTDYVTMAHVTSCAATNAPTTGWSRLTGGSAQDLPGEDGM